MPDAPKPDAPVTTLILTSSGGGGHITAAKAKKEEAIKAKTPEKAIRVIDLMGIVSPTSIADNQGEPWVPTYRVLVPSKSKGVRKKDVFSGEANTKKWDDLQKQGGMESVRALEGLVDKQWMAESIQYNSVYENVMKFLEANPDVTRIIDTQALSTPAVCAAVCDFNAKRGKDIKVTKVVTEFLTHKATHFLGPLGALKEEHREVLTVEVVAPPLLGPGETIEQFYAQHGVTGIKFDYLSERGVEPNVRKEFRDMDFNMNGTIVIKANVKEGAVNEADFLQKALEGVATVKPMVDNQPNGNKEFTIQKGAKDKLITITMGSQVSKTILEYIDKFIDDASKLTDAELQGNVYFCLVGLKNPDKPGPGEVNFYKQVNEHIAKRIKEVEAAGKSIPSKVKILPLGFQDGKQMASLLQTSDMLVTRSGGMSSIEAEYTQRKNPKRRTYVHSEMQVSNPATFPLHNYDAVYEGLIAGTVKWEGGNAEYLMAQKHVKASLCSPTAIDFDIANRNKEVPVTSLFHMAYDKDLKIANAEKIQRLVMTGSNPNLRFNDGSHLIDHCQDVDTMKQLIELGAKLTPAALKKEFINKEQKKMLQHTHKKSDLFRVALDNAMKNDDVEVVKGIMHSNIKFCNFDYFKKLAMHNAPAACPNSLGALLRSDKFATDKVHDFLQKSAGIDDASKTVISKYLVERKQKDFIKELQLDIYNAVFLVNKDQVSIEKAIMNVLSNKLGLKNFDPPGPLKEEVTHLAGKLVESRTATEGLGFIRQFVEAIQKVFGFGIYNDAFKKIETSLEAVASEKFTKQVTTSKPIVQAGQSVV